MAVSPFLLATSAVCPPYANVAEKRPCNGQLLWRKCWVATLLSCPFSFQRQVSLLGRNWDPVMLLVALRVDLEQRPQVRLLWQGCDECVEFVGGAPVRLFGPIFWRTASRAAKAVADFVASGSPGESHKGFCGNPWLVIGRLADDASPKVALYPLAVTA
jgi:hypothetical protein